MADDAVQLERRIRFALDTLAENNSHHEFELLCLGLARRRITSNLHPATGPVSSGGDQGRDAESHWTNIPRELPGTSVFEALASTERVVMACTIQKTKVPAKILKDLSSICGQGTAVDRVIYFTVAPVPSGKQHKLIEEAARTHQVELDIWDAAALAVHLADHDLFYLAVQYLHLPSDLAPARPEAAGHLPDWYIQARQRWREREEPGCTLGDLIDLKAPLRHATFHAEARADLPDWLGHAHALLDATPGTHTALRVRYEIVVATLRGLETMLPVDGLARDIFTRLTTDDSLEDPGLLEDAVVLLGYTFGALMRGLTAVTPDELRNWQRKLEEKTDRLLDERPAPNATAHLLALRARLALHPEVPTGLRKATQDLPSVAEVTARVREAMAGGQPLPVFETQPAFTDIDTGMQTLALLGRHLDDAPLFPVEHVADIFDLLAPALVDHPLYREVRDLLDTAIDRVAGQSARGERAQARGLALVKSDRLLEALREIHEAKLNWWRGETLEGGLTMLLLCSRIYSELGLAMAAKQCALAAAAAARSAPDQELTRFVPRGIILAAQYDHQAGNWLSATHLFRIGLMAQNAYLDEPFNAERYPYVWDMMANQALTVNAALAVRPRFAPMLREVMASVGFATAIDEIVASIPSEPAATEDMYVNEADAQGVGRPFSDAGPKRRYTWSALGVDWEVTCANDRPSALAAERFTAAVQVLVAEMATRDPLLLPGRLAVEIQAETVATSDRHDGWRQVSDPNANRWILRLAAVDSQDLEAALNDLTAAAVSVLISQSLLPNEAFTKLIEESFAAGLWHKLVAGRPYDELADFLNPGDYEAMAALAEPAVGAATALNGRPKSAALKAKTGPGPGYEQSTALENVRHRYTALVPIIRYTLPRLSADREFMRTAVLLREQGWKDWHLLTAIANLVGNRRLEQRGLRPAINDSAERRIQFKAVMTAHELPDDEPVPPQAFTLSALRSHLHGAALATAGNLGLVVRSTSLRPEALLRLLGDRYGYWTDDAEHADMFVSRPPSTTGDDSAASAVRECPSLFT
ncbi:hypothetical protein GCM10010222_11650 [Streptomyces tanashiensis]|uniref:hypothetical protein n=1 Tax=Streptomyces tanashiensis TaxID=67367 RepID=UPI0016774104|nr:hypothetical protein [Streptomyces tanashiensis]GGS72516.1 hypothetical protein GCM10010222_11650 [Streptomyces tanashiensis]